MTVHCLFHSNTVFLHCTTFHSCNSEILVAELQNSAKSAVKSKLMSKV